MVVPFHYQLGVRRWKTWMCLFIWSNNYNCSNVIWSCVATCCTAAGSCYCLELIYCHIGLGEGKFSSPLLIWCKNPLLSRILLSGVDFAQLYHRQKATVARFHYFCLFSLYVFKNIRVSRIFTLSALWQPTLASAIIWWLSTFQEVTKLAANRTMCWLDSVLYSLIPCCVCVSLHAVRADYICSVGSIRWYYIILSVVVLFKVYYSGWIIQRCHK